MANPVRASLKRGEKRAAVACCCCFCLAKHVELASWRGAFWKKKVRVDSQGEGKIERKRKRAH